MTRVHESSVALSALSCRVSFRESEPPRVAVYGLRKVARVMIKCARAEGFFLFKLFYSPPFTKPPLLDNRSEERFRARVSGTLSYEDKSVRRSSNGTIVDAYDPEVGLIPDR